MEGIIEEVVAEAKKVEDEVKTEVTNVEKKVETAVAAVETKAESEAKAAGKEVINEMQAVEAEVKKFATEARIVISAEENLMLTKMENAYLKGQMEIRRLTDEAKAISEQYPRKVAELVKKYAINESTHVFNAIEGAFVKR